MVWSPTLGIKQRNSLFESNFWFFQLDSVIWTIYAKYQNNYVFYKFYLEKPLGLTSNKYLDNTIIDLIRLDNVALDPDTYASNYNCVQIYIHYENYSQVVFVRQVLEISESNKQLV